MEGKWVALVRLTAVLASPGLQGEVKGRNKEGEVFSKQGVLLSIRRWRGGAVELCWGGGGCFYLAKHVLCVSRYKRLIRRSNIKIVEAPVRALIPASLPPGSIMGMDDIYCRL